MNTTLPYIKYIADMEHYNDVLSMALSTKHELWLGTSDLKDLYVRRGREVIPFLEVLSILLRRNVEVRLLHAKQPGEIFMKELHSYPILGNQLLRMRCPRVHFKIIIIDCHTAYIGSANLTGAGVGIKSQFRRNFEAGILTNESSLVDAAIKHFDSVWSGSHCSQCGRKLYCE